MYISKNSINKFELMRSHICDNCTIKNNGADNIHQLTDAVNKIINSINSINNGYMPDISMSYQSGSNCYDYIFSLGNEDSLKQAFYTAYKELMIDGL